MAFFRSFSGSSFLRACFLAFFFSVHGRQRGRGTGHPLATKSSCSATVNVKLASHLMHVHCMSALFGLLKAALFGLAAAASQATETIFM